MSLFKKIFGSQENKEEQTATKEQHIASDDEISWMTDSRRETLSICRQAGFRPANWLPTQFDKKLRPAIEIASRLNAIKALVLWLMVPEEHLPSEEILNFVETNRLQDLMSDEEKAILSLSRDDEEARNTIGWKFENAWPLAWYFGYEEPDIHGEMMTAERMQDIIANYTCPLEGSVKEWLSQHPTAIAAEDVSKKEDLFYCLHNAVRSAQLGSDTVPDGFHPIANGGVIHERRHSLTWMLSDGTPWDETDLST